MNVKFELLMRRRHVSKHVAKLDPVWEWCVLFRGKFHSKWRNCRLALLDALGDISLLGLHSA